MKKSYLECESCKRLIQIEPQTYGGNPYIEGWITVQKTCGSSSDKISTGTSHFCEEKCLLDTLSK